MNESYVKGFMSKCAEYGVPEDSAVELLKLAQMQQIPSNGSQAYGHEQTHATMSPKETPATTRAPRYVQYRQQGGAMPAMPDRPQPVNQYAPKAPSAMGTENGMRDFFKKNPKFEQAIRNIINDVHSVSNMTNSAVR